MGRRRTDNPEGLPPCVYRRRGALYYVGKHADGTTRWTKLGDTWAASREAYEHIVTAARGSSWIDRNLYPDRRTAVPRRELMLLLRNARKNGASRGLECTLTMDDMQRMSDRAGGKCELSGLPFEFGVAAEMVDQQGRRRRLWAASIDRVNGRVGYTPENCRLVCMAVNAARQEFGDAVLFKIARALSNIQRNASANAQTVRGETSVLKLGPVVPELDT